MNYYSIQEAAINAIKKLDQINNTPTMTLVSKIDEKVADGMKNIVSRYQGELNYLKLNDNEKEVLCTYLVVLGEAIKHDCKMCKAIPSSQIKDVIELKRDLSGYFAREADIKYLLTGKSDYFNALYNELRLDYPDSKFEKNDRYIGVLEVDLPKFSLRTPLTSGATKGKLTERYVIKEFPEPYSGIGITASQYGIPEFYISINNDGSGDFPQESFSSDLFIIGHDSQIMKLASYDSGDFDCAADEKYIVYERMKNVAKINKWID
jgi:hypothetical protein